MGKKRKLVDACNHHQPRLQAATSLSSLTSAGDCLICNKEPVGPAKKLFSNRKKSRQDDLISNFKIPNPVLLFSNRVTKRNPFFNNLKVKCHPIGSSHLLQKWSSKQSKKQENLASKVAGNGNEEKISLEEDLYCVPHEVLGQSGKL